MNSFQLDPRVHQPQHSTLTICSAAGLRTLTNTPRHSTGKLCPAAEPEGCGRGTLGTSGTGGTCGTGVQAAGAFGRGQCGGKHSNTNGFQGTPKTKPACWERIWLPQTQHFQWLLVCCKQPAGKQFHNLSHNVTLQVIQQAQFCFLPVSFQSTSDLPLQLPEDTCC